MYYKLLIPYNYMYAIQSTQILVLTTLNTRAHCWSGVACTAIATSWYRAHGNYDTWCGSCVRLSFLISSSDRYTNTNTSANTNLNKIQIQVQVQIHCNYDTQCSSWKRSSFLILSWDRPLVHRLEIKLISGSMIVPIFQSCISKCVMRIMISRVISGTPGCSHLIRELWPALCDQWGDAVILSAATRLAVCEEIFEKLTLCSVGRSMWGIMFWCEVDS